MEGLPFEVEYSRKDKQTKFIFYIRTEDGNRPYPEQIKKQDKIYYLGIYDPTTKSYSEWKYTFRDLEFLWFFIISNTVKVEERQKIMKNWNRFIEKTINSGILPKFCD